MNPSVMNEVTELCSRQGEKGLPNSKIKLVKDGSLLYVSATGKLQMVRSAFFQHVMNKFVASRTHEWGSLHSMVIITFHTVVVYMG